MSLYVNIPDAGSAGGSSVTSPLSGDGSGGNPIVIAAASAATAGTMSIADFNKSATVPTGAGILLAAYQTAVIDLAALGGPFNINMPVGAGLRFHMAQVPRLDLATRDATLTTQLIYKIQQNGVDTVLTGINITTANLNLFTPPANIAANVAVAPIFDLSTFPLQITITQAAAGAGLTTCTARFTFIGYYAA